MEALPGVKGSLRERWLGRRAVARGAALAAALLLTAAPAGARETLTPRDLEAALVELESLGGFFGAFAARETNALARERWQRLSRSYPGTAEILRGLLADRVLRLEDLPAGRVSGLLDRGEILLDVDLDGRWGDALVPGDAAARRRDLLLPALVEALARRQAPQDWPWLADHLRAVGGFAALAQDPVARPLLARFFLAKDGYLWLALQRVGEGDPAVRRALAGRQAATMTAVRGLAAELAATFGPDPGARLERDWERYVASVDGFAVTRGWLLLDPALRQTRLGTAIQRDADAVREGAAEMVAAAPRSALAAARAAPAQAAAPATAPDLGSLVEQAAEEPPVQALVPPGESASPRHPDEAARPAVREAVGVAAAEQPLAPAVAAPQVVVAPPAVIQPRVPLPAQAEPRPLYRLAAVAVALAVIVLLALLLWRRRRAQPAAALPLPLLLSAPAASDVALPIADVAAVAPPVVAPVPPPEAAAAMPRAVVGAGGPVRVNGVTPPTPAARAAMKAGEAQQAAAGALRAPAAEDAVSEAETAAHPIVQALRKGNLPLFELLFGELTDLRAPQLQRIAYGGRGEDLAIVCRAVGVDKLLFGAIFLLTDHLRGGQPEEEPERAAEILRIYDRMPPATARKVLAKWQSDWSPARRGTRADV